MCTTFFIILINLSISVVPSSHTTGHQPLLCLVLFSYSFKFFCYSPLFYCCKQALSCKHYLTIYILKSSPDELLGLEIQHIWECLVGEGCSTLTEKKTAEFASIRYLHAIRYNITRYKNRERTFYTIRPSANALTM